MMWQRLGEMQISRVVRWSFILQFFVLLFAAEWLLFKVWFREELNLKGCLDNPSSCEMRDVFAYYKKHRKRSEFYRKEPWKIYQLALIMADHHQRKRALKLLRRAVAAHPEDTRLAFEAAAFAYQQEDKAWAKSLLQPLLAHVDGEVKWTVETWRQMKRTEAPLHPIRQLGGRPEAYRIHHYLGLIAYEEKDYPEAAYHLERSLVRQPHDVGLLRLTAYVWKQQEQFDRAAELLRHAVELSEESPQIKMELAYVLLKGHSHREAELLLREVLKGQPDNEPALQALLAILLAQARYEEAAHLLEPRIAKYPERWDLKHRLARLYGWLHRYDESLKLYQELMQSASESPQIRLDLEQGYADTLFDAGLYANAADLYRDLLDRRGLGLSPGREADIRLALARSLALSDQPAEAAENYQRLLQEGLGYGEAHLEMARLTSERQGALEAKPYYERVITLLEALRSVKALNQKEMAALTEAYRGAGQGENAYFAVRRWVEKYPEEAEGWRQYARILTDLDRREAAEKVWRRVLALKDKCPLDRVELAHLLWNRGKREEGEALYRQFVHENPSHRDGVRMFAEDLSAAKRYGEAKEVVETYLRAKPDDLGMRRQLAQLLSWEGDHDRSLEIYRELIEH